MKADARQYSGAAERNRAPLLAQLLRLLPPQGLALEIASGTGQHAAHFAAGLPGWRWQPTDGEPLSVGSIEAWCEGLANVQPALHVDVCAAQADGRWAGVPQPVDAVFCANLLHIAPWKVCAALMRGAAAHLGPHGLLLLYGPYFVDGEPTAPSNIAFDADLRARDPAWGLRRLSSVLQQAQDAGLHLRERVGMPANNLLLVLARPGASATHGHGHAP